MAEGTYSSDPIYSDSLFRMAKRQFEVIADYLEIAEGDRERIIYPKRAVSVAVPIPETTAVWRSFTVIASSTISPSAPRRAERDSRLI